MSFFAIFWVVVSLCAILTYHSAGLLIMYFKVERWQEKANDLTHLALTEKGPGFSLFYSTGAQVLRVKAERNRRVIQCFWPYL